MADESGSSATTGGGTEEFHNSDLSTLLRLLQQQQPASVTTTNKQYQPVSIAVKLDEFNFSVWSRLMRMAIGGRGSLSHITGNPPPPSPEDPEYTNWEQEDLKVQSDIIHNLSSYLVALYVEFPTARDLWNGLNETYSTGRDYLQLFDLKRQANRIKQEDGTIETYHGILSRLWREIGRREPNPMTAEADIATFNRGLFQAHKVSGLVARGEESGKEIRRRYRRLGRRGGHQQGRQRRRDSTDEQQWLVW
ncbi:Unknown protein [Striga hermonthica]|uniref:Retrotransposon Copia-like N-terminal domain-containing protein n=1 Tax=Striga hermonthica TaxID=68872 RepID=A0A9N7P2J2_STRHE|nr:Unknown protein [Striga hermonthica]